MKARRILVWLLIPAFGFAVSYFAITGRFRRIWEPAAKNHSLISYPTTLNLGDQEMGDIAVAHFVIENHGSEELVIDQIHANCSCTGIEREENGRYERVGSLRLQGGAHAELVIRVAVQSVPSGMAMVNHVDFQTNDPTHPTGCIEAVIERVTSGVRASPKSIVFGTVAPGTKVRQVVDIRDSAVPPRVVDHVISKHPERISIELLPATPNSNDGELGIDDGVEEGVVIARIAVLVRTALPGTVSDAIQIQMARGARDPETIGVFGRISAPVDISPSLLILPRASSSVPVYSGICIFHSTSGVPLSLKVESVPIGITADILDQDSASMQSMRITWKPQKAKKLTSSQRKVIRIRATVGPDETLLELPIILQPQGVP